MLPRFPSHCHLLLRAQSDLGNAAIVQRAPKLPLCLPPSLSLLFSQQAKRRTPALQCLFFSISTKLSLASHEKQWNFIGDRIANGVGGFNIKHYKKRKNSEEGLVWSLSLSGHYLWGDFQSCFRTLHQWCRERPRAIQLGFWLPNPPNPFQQSFFILLSFTIFFKKSSGHSIPQLDPLFGSSLRKIGR